LTGRKKRPTLFLIEGLHGVRKKKGGKKWSSTRPRENKWGIVSPKKTHPGKKKKKCKQKEEKSPASKAEHFDYQGNSGKGASPRGKRKDPCQWGKGEKKMGK